MRTGLSLLAVSVWGAAALAEPVPADCARLAGLMAGFGDYRISVAPQAAVEGWCVLDGAAFKAEAVDLPDVSVDRLRLRGAVAGEALVALEVEAAGLRVRPKAADRAMDDRLRSIFRLQSADLSLAAAMDPSGAFLDLANLTVSLTDGTEIDLDAEIDGAGLEAAALAGGRLTFLTASLRLDDRLMQSVMELAGAGLEPGATGSAAVDAVREVLRGVMGALPGVGDGDSDSKAVDAWLRALPYGRGKLTVSFYAKEGIGAARLVMLGLAEDPLAPEAIAALFQGAEFGFTWQPGLAP